MMISKPQQSGREIDWNQLRERLAAAQPSSQHGDQLAPEQEERLLHERARLLAQVPEQPPDASEILEVIVFTMAGEDFALETRFVREVTKPGRITPLPGAPQFLVGVTNLRGQVTAVVDLRVLFDIGGSDKRQAAQVLVLGTDRTEFAITLDRIDQVTNLRIDEVLPPPGSLPGASRKYLRGVTSKPLMILDGEVLLADELLYVDEVD